MRLELPAAKPIIRKDVADGLDMQKRPNPRSEVMMPLGPPMREPMRMKILGDW
jgi:hypothetical protein